MDLTINLAIYRVVNLAISRTISLNIDEAILTKKNVAISSFGLFLW